MIRENTTTPTYKPQRRAAIIALQRFAGFLHRCGAPNPNFTEVSVMKAAQRMTGLKDWGDESFREPLRVLLDDYQNDERLSYVGRWAGRGRCVRLCANRLMIQDEVKRHPEIPSLQIRKPLFVVGLPRTGTTLLLQLLAQDPTGRPLLTWESFGPSVSAKEERKRVDPRIRRAVWMIRALNYAAPELRVIHPMDPLGPEECLGLLASTFESIFLADGPRYLDWLLDRNHEQNVAAYEYYKLQLQILQRQRANDHWVLKSPAHLYALDSLTEVLPDACVVHTHRDPLDVVPSGCSLYSILAGLMWENGDMKGAGQIYVDRLTRSLDRVLEARNTIEPHRVFDLHFEQLMQDPIGCVRKIYEYFDYEMSPEMERGMMRHMQEKPRHKHGVHRYTLEQFGLDAETLNRVFEPYCDRFQVQMAQKVS